MANTIVNSVTCNFVAPTAALVTASAPAAASATSTAVQDKCEPSVATFAQAGAIATGFENGLPAPGSKAAARAAKRLQQDLGAIRDATRR